MEQINQETPASFADLQKNAEAGFVRRGIARYFITKNPERSIRRHRRLGTPILANALMSIIGPFRKETHGTNYRLSKHTSKLEASTAFALSGSVFNEAVHGTMGTLQLANLAINHDTGALPVGVISAMVAWEAGLVAVQRYNRARSIRVANWSLRHGTEFTPDYRNWLGIDARAQENFRQSRAIDVIEPEQVDPTTLDIELAELR